MTITKSIYRFILLGIFLFPLLCNGAGLLLTPCDDGDACTIDSCVISENNIVTCVHDWDTQNCGQCQPQNSCSGMEIDQCAGQCNDCNPCTVDICGPCSLDCHNSNGQAHLDEFYFCQCVFARIKPAPLGCGGNFPDCKWQLSGLLL